MNLVGDDEAAGTSKAHGFNSGCVEKPVKLAKPRTKFTQTKKAINLSLYEELFEDRQGNKPKFLYVPTHCARSIELTETTREALANFNKHLKVQNDDGWIKLSNTI